MPEPVIGKYPIEIFGYSYLDTSQRAVEARKNQYCPFLNNECKKPRKSEPDTKVGICTVGYKGRFMYTPQPVIICPYRFELDVIFELVERKQFGPLGGDVVKWTSEVSLGTMGSVDFVGARLRKTSSGLRIDDFVCLEIQAAGTTGTPWPAVRELTQSGQFSKDSYSFGINWANEFAKTMMQQAYKKGMIIEAWERKLVFAIQDVGLNYLQAVYNTSGLHPARKEDSIYFYTFKMSWEEESSSWVIEPATAWGTDTEGVRKILSGASDDDLPTRKEFVKRIYKNLGISALSEGQLYMTEFLDTP